MTQHATLDRVMLINPPVHDFAAFDLWAKPMGLLVAAKYLQAQGIETVLVDAMDPHSPFLDGLPKPPRMPHGKGKYFEVVIPKPKALADVPRIFHRFGLPPDRLKKAIAAAGPARAALVTTMMTYWYPGAFEAIAAVREVFPSMPIMFGGGYATLCAKHARENSGADFVVEGRFEESEAAAELLGIELPDTPLFSPQIDIYPKLDYAPVLTSRGCPFRCGYCASKLLFPKYVEREVEETLDDISAAYKQGIRDFVFYDDALALSTETRLVLILEGVLSRGYDIRFHAPNAMHVSGIDADLTKLMKRAGFVTVRLGVETTSSGQNRHDNKLDPSILPQAADAFFKAGWKAGEIGAYILTGLPGQAPEDVEKDIKALWNLGLRPYLAEFSPIPGTALFLDAKKVSRYDIEAEPLTHNCSIFPCATESFTREDLQKLKEKSWPKKVDRKSGDWLKF